MGWVSRHGIAKKLTLSGMRASRESVLLATVTELARSYKKLITMERFDVLGSYKGFQILAIYNVGFSCRWLKFDVLEVNMSRETTR